MTGKTILIGLLMAAAASPAVAQVAIPSGDRRDIPVDVQASTAVVVNGRPMSPTQSNLYRYRGGSSAFPDTTQAPVITDPFTSPVRLLTELSNVFDPCNAPKSCPITANARAAAVVDFERGKLGVEAFGSRLVSPDPLNPSVYTANAQASALLRDTIYFDTADDLSELNFTLSIDMDGNVSGSSSQAFMEAYFYQILPQPRPNELRSSFNWSRTISNGVSSGSDPLGWTVNGSTYSTNIRLFGPDPVMNFDALLRASTAGGFVDFLHTASFDFVLPTDVSFTSASGTFLTGPSAAVPEPATWAMLILGFGLAGAALRRFPRPALAAMEVPTI